MKTTKCKYCEHRFVPKEWHNKEEKVYCRGCLFIRQMIGGLISGLPIYSLMSDGTRKLWTEKLNLILNELPFSDYQG